MKTLKIKTIKKLEKKLPVFDLSVDDNHNFFVGEKEVLTSNCDGMSGSAMRILRNTMEEYNETTRFILTANDFNRIIEPIRSRCIHFNLKPDLKGCAQRCFYILKEEGIEIGENSKSLIEFIKQRFPDMRRIINDLQKSCISGELKITVSNQTGDFVKKIIDMLFTKKSVFDIRKMIIENESDFNSDYQNFYTNFFNFFVDLKNTSIEEIKKKEILLELGEYQYRDNFVVDHEINFFCFILSVERILKN